MPIDSTTRRALLHTDWRDIGVRLTAYAAWRAGNLQWRRGTAGVLAAGKAAEDLAAEAIEKVLSGERRWDPRRGELLSYLRGVVDSLASHLAESHDNRRYTPWEGETGSPVEEHPGDENTRKVAALRAALRRDGQTALLEVIDAITLHCDPTPRAIAATLGTSVADINNRLKRLRRCALRVAAQLVAENADEVTHG